MDHYGIGAAMRAMVSTYTMTARRTGRTTSLVESVKTGDRIVFADRREADRVKRLCKERGVDVDCIVVEPRHDQIHKLFERGTPEGRSLFDHMWVERFYEASIAEAGELIDRWERETTGYGAAHRETRRRAEEQAKWVERNGGMRFED